jgi:hypothetical protein
MNDRTVVRAARQGTHTVPVDPAARSKRVRGNIPLAPDEVQLAVEMARTERIERDIRAYALRKRESS